MKYNVTETVLRYAYDAHKGPTEKKSRARENFGSPLSLLIPCFTLRRCVCTIVPFCFHNIQTKFRLFLVVTALKNRERTQKRRPQSLTLVLLPTDASFRLHSCKNPPGEPIFHAFVYERTRYTTSHARKGLFENDRKLVLLPIAY